MRRAIREGMLFDLLADNPDGLTITQIGAEFDLNKDYMRDVVRTLRLTLGEMDTINLVADNPGDGISEWAYRLVGTYDEARAYIQNRVTDLISRVTTQRAIAASLVRGSDGRTIEGKKAALVHRHLGRLLEDIDTIDASDPNTLSFD